MDNGIGPAPALLALWQRFGAWVERRGPRERVAAQTFFTVNIAVGIALCFGVRPVLAGCRDWLQWRLEAMRREHRRAAATTKPPRISKNGSAPAMMLS